MPLPNTGLSRVATITACLTLLLIGAGALTGGDASGSTLPASLAKYHIYVAVATGVMLILLMTRLMAAIVPVWVQVTGWAGLALFLADSGIAARTQAPPVAAELAVPHAIMATLFFAAMAAIAWYLSRDSIEAPEPVDISPWPSIPAIADITPLVIIFQISLGAAYRHKVFSVMPHMAGAMAATLLLLVLAVLLLQNFPQHPTLRPAAAGAMAVLLLQVTLGIAAFVMRLLDFDTTTGFMFIAAAHICVGALTLAASFVLCIEVRRCCVPGRLQVDKT